MARLSGSFASISHDVNQPLSAAIQTGLGNIFESTPLAILQPQNGDRLADRAQDGAAQRVRPVQRSAARKRGRSGGRRIRRTPKTFQGGLLGTVGGTAIAPGVPGSAVDATVAANQTFNTGFATGQLSCASPLSNPNTCLQPVAITAVPDGKLHAPYFMQWSFALEQQIGNTINLRAQYVGTRAVNQPYTTQVNGYQTVCQGCFAPFPYGVPADPRFGAVTQLSTGANSHYNGLQTTAEKRLGHGLQVQANYTWSHCIDTVSNGGFLPFSAGGILSPIPGDLAARPRPLRLRRARTISPPAMSMNCRSSCAAVLGTALNGWQVSGSVFWHSGLPFSVLSAPYSANGNGIVNGSGPQFASVVPGVPLYEHNPIPGVTQPGTIQWLNPECFRFHRRSEHRRVHGRRYCRRTASSEIWDATPCAVPISSGAILYLTKWFALNERVKLRIDGQFFNLFNHPNFGLPIAGDMRAFPASLPRRPVSARSPPPPRRRPVCWGSDWAATARRA